MEGMLLFVLFGVVAAGVALLAWYLAKQRREALARAAAGLGLSFSARDPFAGSRYEHSSGFLGSLFGGSLSGVPGRFGQFGALSRGDSRRAYNVMRGAYRGREVCAFDYRYCTGSGKNRSTHHLSAAVVSTGARFPEIYIRPENLLDKLAGAVGFEDIDFESHEFSKKFFVKARDRKLAYDVVHPRAMEYLLAHPRWSVELDGTDALVSTGRRWRPEEFARALDHLAGFLDLVPEFVWKDLASRKEAG